MTATVLCTLVINEMEWLPKLREQHKDWPGMVKHVFVEAADALYASTNPGMVTADGLSTDGTTEFLERLAREDDRVIHVRHGFCGNLDPAQGKCAARQRYLDEAEKVKPGMLVVLDADEFWTKRAQLGAGELLAGGARWQGYYLRHREVWRPPVYLDSIAPLFWQEVKGGFWDIPYCRVWRWQPGLRYDGNHNTPKSRTGVPLDKIAKRCERDACAPEFCHLGYASALKNRQAKNAYYVARGEGVNDHRGWYVQSRAAWEKWQPGDKLPRGAEVVPWTAEIPEVFR